MSRPHYQTREDLITQEAIAAFIAERLRCTMKLIPKRGYFVDYLAEFPGGRRVIVEVKDRPAVRWGDDVGVGVEKMISLQNLCNLFDRVRGVFAIRSREGIVGWTYVSDIGDNLYVGGRYDRNDPDDIELMVSIPAAHFRRIGQMEVQR